MTREDVSFVSGGERCAGWLYLPEGAEGPVPFVVLCSGFSFVRDQGLDAFAARFAQAGVGALAFDYRHFGDSGGEPRQLALSGRQREDLRAALAFCRSLDPVDRGRIALWGYSFGGAHVQRLAAGEPGIAAAICVAPVVDQVRSLLHIGGPGHVARLTAAGLRDGLRALRGAEPYRVPAAGPPRSLAVMNSPDAVPGMAGLTRRGSTWRNEVCARVAIAPPYRLRRKLRRIACPVLYCIAEEDDINPPELGMEAARRVADGELRLYPGGHFDHTAGPTFERMVADQLDFLRRRL